MSATAGETALSGGFADPPIDAAIAFRAALNAMARPGRIETVEGTAPPEPLSVASAALLLTLCDAETPLFLAPGHDTRAVRDWLAFHTGAPVVGAEKADFALGTWDALSPVSRFRIGTAEYPDRSATLIVACDALTADTHRLTGPGIETEMRLRLPELAAFKANSALFPLGFDCFFAAGAQLAALPRTTRVEEVG